MTGYAIIYVSQCLQPTYAVFFASRVYNCLICHLHFVFLRAPVEDAWQHWLVNIIVVFFGNILLLNDKRSCIEFVAGFINSEICFRKHILLKCYVCVRLVAFFFWFVLY